MLRSCSERCARAPTQAYPIPFSFLKDEIALNDSTRLCLRERATGRDRDTRLLSRDRAEIFKPENCILVMYWPSFSKYT